MDEKIISEKVISSRKVQKQGYVQEKWGNLKESISAFCMAPVLILVAVGLMFYGEMFHKTSDVLQGLKLEQATDVFDKSGMVMFEGNAVPLSKLEEQHVGQVLYFSLVKEKYEEVEEKVTETKNREENGEQYEDTVETTKMVDKWVTKEEHEPVWADFKVGEIKIDPTGADLKLDLNKAEYKVAEDGAETKMENGQKVEEVLGNTRIVISYLPIDVKLLVVGEINNNEVSEGGSEYIITTKSAKDLLSAVQSAENTWYWVIKVIIWLLLTIGFTSVVGPIIALVDFIPLVGSAARSAAGVVSAILALLILVVATLMIKFWWLLLIIILLGLVAMVGLLIYLWKKNSK